MTGKRYKEASPLWISLRTIATVINGREKRDKRQTWAVLLQEKIRPPDSVCACELFLNRDLKSYGDKSPPRHTNSTIYNRKGSLFLAPAYLVLSRWMQSAGQYFLIQRRNRSKAVIQRKRGQTKKKKKSFKGSGADWVEGAAADCALPCRQALAGTTHRRKKKKKGRAKRSKRRPPFLFSPYSPRLRKQAWAVGSAR